MNSVSASLKTFVAAPSFVAHAQVAMYRKAGERAKALELLADDYKDQSHQIGISYTDAISLSAKRFSNFVQKVAVEDSVPFAAKAKQLGGRSLLCGVALGISPIRNLLTSALLGAASGTWPPLLAVALATWVTPIVPITFAQTSLFLFGTGRSDPGRAFDLARDSRYYAPRSEPNHFRQYGLLGTMFEAAPRNAAERLEERGHSVVATCCLVGASIGHLVTESLRAVSAVTLGALTLLVVTFQSSVLGFALLIQSPLLFVFPGLGSILD